MFALHGNATFFALFSLEHGMSSGRIYIVICKKAMLHYKDSIILCLTLQIRNVFWSHFPFRDWRTEPAVDVSKSTSSVPP